MCGRYTNTAEFSEIRLRFKIEHSELFREWQPAYNITPSYGPGFEQLIVLSAAAGTRTLRLARWWLIPPFWKKPLKALPASFNARAEDLASKPFFKKAFHEGRCLVPATGWREFTGMAGHKQPHHFHFQHGLFAFAGLWSAYTTPDGQVVDSFAIVTTKPSSIAAPIHDRMPLALSEAEHAAWLNPMSDPTRVLREAEEESLLRSLDVYASDPVGNSGRFEGQEVLRPAPTLPEAVQQDLFTQRKD